MRGSTGLSVLAYGALAATVAGCLWLLSLAPMRFDAGREVVAAAIALAGVALGVRWARAQSEARARRVDPGASDPPPAALQASVADGPVPRPSPREARVLALLAEGHPNKVIARELGVSENTVKTHLANLYAKLGASRRTEAIAKARELGWLA